MDCPVVGRKLKLCEIKVAILEAKLDDIAIMSSFFFQVIVMMCFHRIIGSKENAFELRQLSICRITPCGSNCQSFCILRRGGRDANNHSWVRLTTSGLDFDRIILGKCRVEIIFTIGSGGKDSLISFEG